MSDLAMVRFLAAKAVGEVAWASPSDLQLNEAQFHAAVQSWMEQHGGPGFQILDSHRESESSQRQYDLIQVRRTS